MSIDSNKTVLCYWVEYEYEQTIIEGDDADMVEYITESDESENSEEIENGGS